MMKKTLIALALATTAVSGSAMAWSSSGSGGVVQMSGQLATPANENPWEVLLGSNVADLNMPIALNTKVASLTTTKPIPVLGIRTVSKEPFLGGPGLSPVINYGNSVDFTKASDGVVPMTLDIKDAGLKKIGTMSASLFTAGIASRASIPGVTNAGSPQYASMIGADQYAFLGGIASFREGVAPLSVAQEKLTQIYPDGAKNFTIQGATVTEQANTYNLNDPIYSYSAYYGAGIPTGSNIVINFTNNVTGATTWTASLPIQVTYQ